VNGLALAGMAESRRITTAGAATQTGSIPSRRPVYDFSNLFSLERVEILPAAVVPGDTIRIGLFWKCISPLPREDVYRLFVRMDTDFPKGRLFEPSFEKPYRKFVEHRLGVKFRCKVDVDPETWIPPLHLWRKGELVREEVPFAVPAGLFPGKYAVKVNLKRVSASINFHVSDFLRDEDYYSGIETGNVVVGTRRAGKLPVPEAGVRQSP